VRDYSREFAAQCSAMPDILDGTIEPGKVFDATTDIDGIPNGYQDMDDRKTLKVYVKL
jgi:threonine dehydrogenase-like Zn-dependent dehydrogenase